MAERSEIDEVRTRTDILAVVEQYVGLKKNGKVFKGLCPFHNEKTPSFQVSPEMERWHCFGCGEGGDVIKFVQKIENLSFVEALEKLALRAGITLTRPGGLAGQRNQYQEVSERDRIYKVNGIALRYFKEMLAASDVAQRYIEDRKIAPETQQEFSLGYAPEGWDGLTSYLARNKVPAADAVLAELITRNDRGGYYDKLRGRLIFPIFDVQDRPIAFGGRILGPSTSGQPKYWNSPEHPAFNKSRTLYGLGWARKSISTEGFVIIVEGYTDVISAHQAGIKNVVAPLGTALTEEHVKTLARLAPIALLCFDADSAGLKAAFRAADIFEANSIEVRVLDLPEGEDPDSMLRSGRREEFAQAITNAVPLVEYRVRRLIRQEAAQTDRDRVGLMRKAMPILGAVKSVIERDQYVKMLAPYHPSFRFGTASAEEQIRQDVTTYLSTHGGDGRAPAQSPQPQRAAPIREAIDMAERVLIRSLLSGDPLYSGRVLAEVAPDDFLTDRGKALARVVYAELGRNPAADVASVVNSIVDEALANAITDIVMGDEEPLSEPQVDGVVSYLKTRSSSFELAHLKELINRGEASSDDYARFARLSAQLKGSK